MLDLCLESTSFLEKVKGQSIVSLVEKGTKHLDDKKETMVTTPLSEKKVLTTEKVRTGEEVDKGTEKLEDMKEAVVTIHKKDSDKYEGQSK